MTSLGFSGQIEATDAERLPVAQSPPQPARSRSRLSHRLAGLAGIVEDQVVPRLVEAHRRRVNEPELAETMLEKPASGEVEELARLVVADGHAAREHLWQLHDSGMSIEAIYLNLMAPTARLLGKNWEDDKSDFADVTVGVGRLQQMLHDFEAAFQSEARAWLPSQRVLLMPAPHEQHTFGLFMIGQFMRRAGWDAWTGPLPPDRDLRKLIRIGQFGVIGFSASSDRHVDELATQIGMVRRVVKDRALCVMVGGYAFETQPALVEQVGADGTAGDARSAIKLAHRLLEEKTTSS